MTFPGRAIYWLPWLLVLALGVGACSQSDSAPNVHREGATASAREPYSVEEEVAAYDKLCRPRNQAINQWLEGYRHCERHEDCAETKIPAACADAFLCPTVLSINIDRAALQREATAKQAEFEPVCGCPIADCSGPLTAYCEPTTKLCGAKFGCMIIEDRRVVCNGGVSPDLETSILNGAHADAATKDASAPDASASSDAGARSDASGR
jgi:hypothetical protein